MYAEKPERTQVIVGSMNMGYISDCQESNSQPVPSQAGADITRPQWGISYCFHEYDIKLIWCQQGNDVVGAAAIRSAMVDFLWLVVADLLCI